MLPFPMFRLRSTDLAPARQHITLASPYPASPPVFRSFRSPFCQRFSPTFGCSLTEQEESKTRASNPFGLKRTEKVIPATPLDSYACKFRGGVFLSAFISSPAFSYPSFRARAHFRYNLSALAPA